MSNYNNSQNQNNGQQPLPKVKTIIDHWGLKLTAKPINGSTRRPSLGVSVYKNEPHFIVYTNVEGDKDKGKIEAKTDVTTFLSSIAALRKIIKGPSDNRITIELKQFRFLGGGRKSETPMLDTKIVVGKDTNGVVFIAVVSWDKDRPTIRFPFVPSNHSNFLNTQGEPLSEAEVSEMRAEAYCDLMTELVPSMLRTHYVEEPRKDPNANQQGGGNRGSYSNQSNQGGYQTNAPKQSSGFDSDSFTDDDIPL
jgi:hypothetical protein